LLPTVEATVVEEVFATHVEPVNDPAQENGRIIQQVDIDDPDPPEDSPEKGEDSTQEWIWQ